MKAKTTMMANAKTSRMDWRNIISMFWLDALYKMTKPRKIINNNNPNKGRSICKYLSVNRYMGRALFIFMGLFYLD
jgi:hypothetical protein